jgi:hypothetical protein
MEGIMNNASYYEIEGSKFVKIDDDFEHSLISAARYAMGRRTYIVSIIVDYIIRLIPTLSDWCISILYKDIQSEMNLSKRIGDTKNFGDSCDYAYWIKIYKVLYEEMSKRPKSDFFDGLVKDKCEECMYDAPYPYCCKRECGEHEFCTECQAKSKGYRSPHEPCS